MSSFPLIIRITTFETVEAVPARLERSRLIAHFVFLGVRVLTTAFDLLNFCSLLLLKGRSRPCQWAGPCCAKVNGLQRIHELSSGVDRIRSELLTGPK